MARTGLGRGLDVLLGSAPATTAPTTLTAGALEIPLEKIQPNRQQPRQQFDQESIAELAASITAHGVLQPIVVSRTPDGFELIAGHRRVLASRVAGKSSIPAVVREDVGDRLELALVENLQRTDLNAIETARAYKLLMMSPSDDIFFMWVDAENHEVVKRTVYKANKDGRVTVETLFKVKVSGVRTAN